MLTPIVCTTPVPQKNVGRVLANEEEVVAVLKKGNMVNVNVVDTATMTYSDQLKVRVVLILLRCPVVIGNR